jgi:hypothetical protein
MAMKKLVVAILALTMAGCSSNQPTPAEKPKPKAPEALTGWRAFQKCFVASRGWAADAKPYRLESEITPDANGQDGKAVRWRAGFASATRRTVRSYTWSNGDMSPNVEDTYSPTNTSTLVFDVAFLKIDSDQALKTARDHGGDKQPADSPVFYLLDWDRTTNMAIWHVIYGTDRDNVKLRIAVNATTGDFVREEK